MISKEERIINQLLGCIYKDIKDKSVIRVNLENVANILSTNGYLLPKNEFEKGLEDLLNKHIVGKMIVGPGTQYTIAKAIIELANIMHIDESKLMKHILENNTPEDAVAMQKRIDEWRKDYYGSMSSKQRESLASNLEGRLRPDVLEKIRRA